MIYHDSMKGHIYMVILNVHLSCTRNALHYFTRNLHRDYRVLHQENKNRKLDTSDIVHTHTYHCY